MLRYSQAPENKYRETPENIVKPQKIDIVRYNETPGNEYSEAPEDKYSEALENIVKPQEIALTPGVFYFQTL